MYQFLLNSNYSDFIHKGYSGGSLSPFSIVPETYPFMVKLFGWPVNDTMHALFDPTKLKFFAKFSADNAPKN